MQFIRMAGWLLVAALAAGSAIAAEKFPQRPVRLIVPYAPGGATDITARLLQQGISELWGQPVIVDNRAGASGNIALELAAKSAPDGYTLQVGNVSTNAINETTFSSLNVKPSRDLTGVTNLIQLPHLWVVSTSVPVSSLRELASYAKKSGSRMNYGSAGVGSYPHLDAVKLLKHMGVEMTHVPYKGGAGQMIPAIMGNEIQFMFITLGPWLRWNWLSRGSSSTHGGHQVAQKLTSKGLPRKSATRTGSPFGPSKAASQNASSASLATGCGWWRRLDHQAPVPAAARATEAPIQCRRCSFMCLLPAGRAPRPCRPGACDPVHRV